MMARGLFTLALIIVSIILFVDTISIDYDITKDLESTIKNDNFILSIKHIKPKKRSRGALETLFAVEFPGFGNKFSLLLDRKTKRVIVETLEDSRRREQYFIVDILREDTIIKSLIISFNQSQPTAHANLYIDCIPYGMVATPKSLKEMFEEMHFPHLEVHHERKYSMQVDGQRDLRAVLSRNECPLPIEKSSDIFSNSKKDDQEIIGDFQNQEPNYYPENYRGDIPLVSSISDVGIINVLNDLIKVVNVEVQKCQHQAEAFDKLRRLIEECELCKQRPPPPSLPTCASNPPNCAAGVRCLDTPQGPRCGECPSGYVGNGYTCTPERSCANNRPCFPGVTCHDTSGGPECGPCPSGYEGNGETCRRKINPCEYNPCAPGCVPVWSTRNANQRRSRRSFLS